MKSFTFAFFFILTFNLYPQIRDITILPFQDINKKYLESSPVVLSENEILIFYCTGNSKVVEYSLREDDTLYYCRSVDNGQTWSSPVFVAEIGKIDLRQYWYLTSLRTSTGRIILAWADWKEGDINLIHSDDGGLNWSEASVISSSNKSFITLSDLESGRLILSYVNNANKIAYYRESSDNGETWSQDVDTFYMGNKTIRSLSFVNLPEKILAFFEYDNAGIYYKVSYDDGFSWSENLTAIDFLAREHNPRILKLLDDWLWLIYQVEDTTYNLDDQNDIYYSQSFNDGNTWNQPIRFTSYVGEDYFLNADLYNDKPLITFSSTRFTNKSQISFAKLGETIETYRPPFITNCDSFSDSIHDKEWILNCKIVDDQSVMNAFVELETGFSTQLFDDGKHEDVDSADNIFGNTIIIDHFSPSNEDIINVNKLSVPINNKGVIADIRDLTYYQNAELKAIDNDQHQIITEQELSVNYNVRSEYEEGGFLFSGGFLLSGYTNGELWSNAVASAMLVEDYLPGVVESDKNDPLNKIYRIEKNDQPFGYSWQRWIDAVALGAEFYDGDGDGNYNPIDKNWNGTWEPNEDMPLLLGDITAWCVYNDGLPKEMRRWNTVDPQGIEVRQTIFASNNSDLEEMIFIRYSILNTGTISEVMDSAYFGIWEDADLGDFQDDVVGCDTIYKSMFTYNNTHDDVYGDNCPAFFTTLMQGPILRTEDPSDTAMLNYGNLIGSEIIPGSKNLDMSSHVFFVGGGPNLNAPNNKKEARNYLLGKDRFGEYPDPCTFSYCEVRGGVDCNEVDPHFWASGDPVTDVGWISRINMDQRNLFSTGPFKLEKDKPQEIIVAFVMGRGTDYFNSITVARENVQRVIQEYESNFASMTYSAPPPTNPISDYVLYHNYPNPFNPATTIRYEMPQDGIVTIKLYDILGQEVTTILNEFQKADRYEVEFNSFGLASGVYIYRMKVNEFIESKKMVLIK
jgi:hypothetical protein